MPIQEPPFLRAARAPPLPKPVPVDLDEVERTFLLVRLADVGAVADAITSRPPPHAWRFPWDRDRVVHATRRVVGLLRQPVEQPILVFTGYGLATMVLIEAIEGNPYFVRMPPGDPRRNGQAIQRAEAVRRKLRAALGVPIGPVPRGEKA